MGERYKNVTKETSGVLSGEYGATPAPVDAALQAKVLDGGEAITCRPADLLAPEVDSLTAELEGLAEEQGIRLAEHMIDDVLTYALFPQVGLKFLVNRDNPDAFEPPPGQVPAASAPAAVKQAAEAPSIYTVKVNGRPYTVEINEGGEIVDAQPQPSSAASAAPTGGGEAVNAALAGNVFKVLVSPGQAVSEGDTVIILEAMKMETEISAPRAGTVLSVQVAEGDAVQVGDALLMLS